MTDSEPRRREQSGAAVSHSPGDRKTLERISQSIAGFHHPQTRPTIAKPTSEPDSPGVKALRKRLQKAIAGVGF